MMRALKALTLIAFRSAAALAPWTTGDTMPTQLVVAPWGASESATQGRVVVNDLTLSALAANQAKYGFDRVALDFEHATFFCRDRKGGDPIKVAAFGTPVCQPGVGILLDNLQWTPEGAEHWKGGHYPDLSPVIAREADGTVTFIHSAALCRQGDIPGLTAFSVEFPPKETLSATEPDKETKPTKTMDPKLLLLTLLAALGVSVPEGASDEQIAAAANQAAEAAKKPAEPAESEPELTALSARIATIEARDQDRERAAIVARASAEGKVIPLDDASLKSMPLAALSVMVDKLPATIALDARTPAGLTAHSARQQDGGMSEIEKTVAKQLGIDEATWKKHNG
jgi:phage I-like protein